MIRCTDPMRHGSNCRNIDSIQAAHLGRDAAQHNLVEGEPLDRVVSSPLQEADQLNPGVIPYIFSLATILFDFIAEEQRPCPGRSTPEGTSVKHLEFDTAPSSRPSTSRSHQGRPWCPSRSSGPRTIGQPDLTTVPSIHLRITIIATSCATISLILMLFIVIKLIIPTPASLQVAGRL